MKISLAPSLEKFVAKKIKSGDYQDRSEVIRDSLRRWKEREEAAEIERDWLEQEIQAGFDSPDIPHGKNFWKDLRQELHEEHKSASRSR
jgi:putative addiction module CopG family antidote